MRGMVTVRGGPSGQRSKFGGRKLTCDCGWTTESLQAESSAARHLRERHGADKTLVDNGSKRLIVCGLDERRLSSAELVEYRALVLGGDEARRVRTARRLRLSVGDFLLTGFILVLCAAFTVGPFSASLGSEDPRGFRAELLGFAGLASILAGLYWVFIVGLADAKRAQWRVVGCFLDVIGFQDRGDAHPSVRPGGDHRDSERTYWATGNYDPERYYRETGSWSREFRNYVKDSYGDLDTYNSNHPD